MLRLITKELQCRLIFNFTHTHTLKLNISHMTTDFTEDKTIRNLVLLYEEGVIITIQSCEILSKLIKRTSQLA